MPHLFVDSIFACYIATQSAHTTNIKYFGHSTTAREIQKTLTLTIRCLCYENFLCNNCFFFLSVFLCVALWVFRIQYLVIFKLDRLLLISLFLLILTVSKRGDHLSSNYVDLQSLWNNILCIFPNIFFCQSRKWNIFKNSRNVQES